MKKYILDILGDSVIMTVQDDGTVIFDKDSVKEVETYYSFREASVYSHSLTNGHDNLTKVHASFSYRDGAGQYHHQGQVELAMVLKGEVYYNTSYVKPL